MSHHQPPIVGLTPEDVDGGDGARSFAQQILVEAHPADVTLHADADFREQELLGAGPHGDAD